ncbi:RNA polymerase sigma factor [Agarilytica rhodophyticola]|uniref:RNA polymerase sigma factor n=1 Tax=Agarilytica rhodophyticola TaxID=1737490 RepID=UPI000B343B61|nr:RNA polymerase sigma factor [Agarilytica rhodophyticola]
MAIENKTALEELFQNHSSGLVRFLSRKMKSTEDAEDIAQNAFIRIQRVASTGELDNLKAYLYQTASNLAIDQLRREKLHNNYVNQETSKHLTQDEGSPSLSDQCTPDRLLTAQRQLKEIKRAMDNLPVKCRQAFLLHRNKGLSYSEIAHEMSVSVSSVEKYILQSLKVCRKTLTKTGEGQLF